MTPIRSFILTQPDGLCQRFFFMREQWRRVGLNFTVTKGHHRAVFTGSHPRVTQIRWFMPIQRLQVIHFHQGMKYWPTTNACWVNFNTLAWFLNHWWVLLTLSNTPFWTPLCWQFVEFLQHLIGSSTFKVDKDSRLPKPFSCYSIYISRKCQKKVKHANQNNEKHHIWQRTAGFSHIWTAGMKKCLAFFF